VPLGDTLSVTVPPVERARGWRFGVSILGLLASIGVGAYVSIVNAGYWLWVAASAYLGIRDKQDVGLGLVATLLGLGPLTAAGLVVRRSQHRGLPNIRSWRRGSLVALAAAFPALLLAAALAVI
jgi:hypothetical protein